MTAKSNHNGLLSRSQCSPQQPLSSGVAVTSSARETGNNATREFGNHDPDVVFGAVVDTFHSFFLSISRLRTRHSFPHRESNFLSIT